MTPTDFSVLLLAWDDADPGVAVLGSTALPPTLPLVYQLAVRHPVLAVYPHLPTAEATAALEPSAPASAPAAASAAPATAPGPLDTETDAPGVHLLARAATAGGTGIAPAPSRLVGLAELAPAADTASPASGATTALGRSQWPTRVGSSVAGAFLAPAAPYVGAATPSYAAARENFSPPPPAPTARVLSGEHVSAEAPAAPAAPEAAVLLSERTASVAAKVPVPFDEPVEEMGAAEARDLDAPENNLVPEATPPTAAQTEATPPGLALNWTVRQPLLNGLNFRMIQYARRAAQLVADRQDFGVIYAPGWPAWLAALEIRNRSGRPLVLYVAALASHTAPAAERGWLLGVERMALRRAALVLVPDAEALRQLRAHHPDALSEVRLVPATDEAAVQLTLAEVARG